MRIIESEHELLLSPETAEDRAACSQIGCKTPFPWDGTARAWRIPRFAVPCLPECVSQLLPDYQTPIRPQPSFLSLLELPEKVQKALFPYQGPEVLKLTTGPYALWAAAGVGKTLMSLSAFYLLYKRGAVDGALVIGPEPGRHVWCGPDSDAQKWIGMPGEYLKTGAKECPEAPILYSTPAKIFRSPYMGWLADKVRTGRWVLIIDEAHTVAGHLTNRFKVLERWSRYCRYIWPLSATPVRNWPDSFWALYRLLTQHELPYATWVEWLQASRHRNSRFWHEDRLEAVSTHLDHCSSTITKAEAAPWLPPVTEHLVKVPMRGRQKELYAALVGTGRMQLEEAGGVSRTVVTKQLLHSLASMASIASHPIVAGEVGAPDKSIAKLEQLDFILSSHYGEKACIWSWHPAVLDWLHKLLWGKAVRYHGQVSPSEKDEAVRRFNNDPKCRYFLGNPSAAGTSLNLGAGTVRVYWDLSWSWHEYHQSGERINRVTRTLPITSYTMVSEDSIEELMWRSIGQKMEMASLLMGRSSDDPIFVHNQAKEILSLWKK